MTFAQLVTPSSDCCHCTEIPPKLLIPVAVITAVLPGQMLAGEAVAAAAVGVPEQGVNRRTLSKPMSLVPRSEVAWKRMIVVAEAVVMVYSCSCHAPAGRLWPKAGEVSAMKLLPPLIAKVKD